VCKERTSEERESLCVSGAGSSAEQLVVVNGNDYTQRQKKKFFKLFNVTFKRVFASVLIFSPLFFQFSLALELDDHRMIVDLFSRTHRGGPS
jgi:hypothetical protein